MKIALITARKITNTWGEEHLGISSNLVSLMREFSYQVKTELNYNMQDIDSKYFLNVDLVILSGGESLGEFIERDKFEKKIIEFSYHHNIPLIGICRGMQIISSYFGVEPRIIDGHSGTKHLLDGQSKKIVNSYHDYGIMTLPKNFQSTHIAPDGSFEGFIHLNKPIAGLMWHPEREISDAYFQDLLNSITIK